MPEPQWHTLPLNLGRAFPTVPRIDRYQRIYDYLTNRDEVMLELSAIDAATSSRQTFLAFLERCERELGFSSDVKTIHALGHKENVAKLFSTVPDRVNYVDNENLIGETAFMQILSAKRPMVDIGAGSEHGLLTHRVQWVMIGMWDRRTRSLGVGEYLVQLYQGLANPNARKKAKVRVVDGPDEPRNLWDIVVDSFNKNATHPEYLHDRFVRNVFPGLYAKWD